MVDDLTRMEHEFNVVGDFEHRVDVNKYHNSFREMIEGVHAIIVASLSQWNWIDCQEVLKV